MISLVFAAVLFPTPFTGTIIGRVRIAPLARADHVKQHTHWDHKESIAGYALEIYKLPVNASTPPISEIGLDKGGAFHVDLKPGRYLLTVEKDMNAGAFVRYPKVRVRVVRGHATHVRLTVHAEYF